MRALLLLFIVHAIAPLLAQVRLNEAMSSNQLIRDEDGDTPDWLEIYNGGPAINLRGWSITDDERNPRKWVFREIGLARGQHLLIWASDKARPYNARENSLHTNFRISSQGESLYLFDAAGQLVDGLVVPRLPPNVSVGIPAGGDGLAWFGRPTPGAANSASSATGQVDGTVNFGRPGGRYGPFELVLDGALAGQEIRYTTDGSQPGATATVYTEPLYVDSTIAIRASIFEPGQLPSQPVSHFYLIDDEHELDVVSIITDPSNFFDDQRGIYVDCTPCSDYPPGHVSNIFRNWEVPVQFSLLPPGQAASFDQRVGAKIFGGYSRTLPQRSISLHARNGYGDRDMDHRFFPQRGYEQYRRLVLRNSGNDWLNTMVRDVTMTGLWREGNLDVQAARPVIAYLNGEYWGLYNLREKVDKHYLTSLHGLDADSISLLEKDGQVIEGGVEAHGHFQDLLRFMRENDLSESDNFAHIAAQMDLDNFAKYQLTQIYYDNRDWPGNNNKFWRPRRPGGKYRWVLFDTDFGGALQNPDAASSETLAYALTPDSWWWLNAPQHTFLLRSLLTNQGFRHRFINQFADEMNSRLRPDSVIDLIEANAARVAGEIPRAFHRWGYNAEGGWSANLEQFKDFFRHRTPHMRHQIADWFELPAIHPATVNVMDSTQGWVELNSLTLDEAHWVGEYFEGVPIRLKAVAKEGYVFDHWRGVHTGQPAEFTINLTAAARFEPVFREASTTTVAAPRVIRRAWVAPNPVGASTTLHLVASCASSLTARLYQADGRPIGTSIHLEATGGPQQFSLPTGHLSSGVHLLTIFSGGDAEQTITLIK